MTYLGQRLNIPARNFFLCLDHQVLKLSITTRRFEMRKTQVNNVLKRFLKIINAKKNIRDLTRNARWGNTINLVTLIRCPNRWQKSSTTSKTFWTFEVVASTKCITSSTKSLCVRSKLRFLVRKPLQAPCRLNLLIKPKKPSIQIINRKGKKWSLCHRPRER